MSSEGKKTQRNVFLEMIRSFKIVVFMILFGVSAMIYIGFFFISINTKQSQLALTQLLYMNELKIIICNYQVLALDENVNRFEVLREKMSYLEEKFADTNAVLYQYITQSQKGMFRTAATEIISLQALVHAAIKNPSDLALLDFLIVRSSFYPSSSTLAFLTSKVEDTVEQANNDRRNLFMIVVISMVTAFIILQITAFRMASIRSSSFELFGDNNKIDWTVRIPFKSHDESGIIANNFNRMFQYVDEATAKATNFVKRVAYQTKRMHQEAEGCHLEVQMIQHSTDRITRQMNHQINSVSQAAAALEQMERTLDIIFNNISRQSAAMTQSAATLEEMGRQVEGVAGISSDTANLAIKLTQVANKGNVAVDASIVSIRDVAEYSSQIIKLLKLITGIAKQTNLLAMNASIEAAHAGEAGRGFAIVAEEIRRLSETTNKNAKEIRTVVDTMVEKVENSVSQVQVAGEDLQQITNYAGNVEERIAQLNNMMQEQNTATQEMVSTIEGLVNLAQEIKFSMEEQQSALREYSDTIGILRENFNDTKSSLDSHMSSINNLLDVISDTGTRIRINTENMVHISQYIESFKVNDKDIIDIQLIEQEQEKEFYARRTVHNSNNDILEASSTTNSSTFDEDIEF